MTPSDLLFLLAYDLLPQGTIWRDPTGDEYVVSSDDAIAPKGGFSRLGTVAGVRLQLEKEGRGVPEAESAIGMLLEDERRTHRVTV